MIGRIGRARQVLVVAGAILLLFAGSSATAYALWQTTAQARFTASAGTWQVNPPTGLTCSQLQPEGVQLSWAAPAGTNPTAYRIYRVGGTTPLRTVTATTVGLVGVTVPDRSRLEVRAVSGSIESTGNPSLVVRWSKGQGLRC